MNKGVDSTMLAQPVQNISANTNNVFTDVLRFVDTITDIKEYKNVFTNMTQNTKTQSI